MYRDFKENLRAAQAYFELECNEAFDELYAEIDAHIDELETQQQLPDGSAWSPSSMEKSRVGPVEAAASIFHDVDA